MSNNWPTVKLGEMLTLAARSEQVDAVKEYRLLGVRLDGRGPFLRETVMGTQTSATKLFRVEKGDFIYSRLFACRGAFGVINEDLDQCYVSGEFPTFVPVPNKVEVNFLKYWFRLPSVIARVDEDCTGSTPLTRNRFKENFFLALQIPLPPLAEQGRLVARIDELTGQIREARTLREDAEGEARALSQAAKRMILSAVKDARRPKLREIAEIRYGISAPISGATDPALGQPIVRMANVSIDGDLNLADMRYIPASAKEQDQFSLQRGDLLLNWRSGSPQHVGKTAIFDREGDYLFASFLLRIRSAHDKVLPEFLKVTLNFMRAEGVFLDSQRFQVNTKLNASEFGEFEISVPSLPEQRRILSELSSLQVQVDALKRLQAETSAELDALLPSILDKAFKGEL